MSKETPPNESFKDTHPSFNIAKARDLLAKGMFKYLIDGDNDVFEGIKNPIYANALSYAGGCPSRTPLYAALHRMAHEGFIKEDSAAIVFSRVADILEEIETTYSKSLATNVGNTICHSYNDDHFERPFMGTIRDILEANKDFTVYASSVIERFQLLRQTDVVKERLPFSERVTDKEIEGLGPIR